MTTNCQWLNSKLEPFFCDTLTNEESQLFQMHLASCAECRRQVESWKELDPLVRGVLQHRLRLAQTPVRASARPRVLKLALAGISVAVAGVLVVLGMRFFQEVPAPPIAVNPPGVQSPVEPEVKKDTAPELNTNLGKPLDGTPVKPAPQPHLDEALANGPDFAITDAAGYTATLETYRGRVFLFGVISPGQKTAVSNLQQIYEAVGSNPGIRIVAVARHREEQLPGATFPLFFNNGSKLLGVQDGQFLLMDATGKSKLEGSLADSASVERIKTQLGQLGIR